MTTGTTEAPAAGAPRELLETRCDRQRVAIIFNPSSGTGDPAARRARIEAAARAAGLTCELAETERKLGAAPLARKAVEEGIQRLIVCGGDGSVTEAASALAGSDVELAVIPGGTGNLLALNLGIPTDPDSAMRLAVEGEARPFDVGRVGGTVFLIMAGMGADARMIRDADRELKRRYGVVAYLLAALRHFAKPPALYTIDVDGQRFRRRAQTVLVANLGRITAGMELVPGADPEDSLLEVAILKAESLRDLITIAGRAFLGKLHGDERVEIHRGRRVVVRGRTAQPVEIDGNAVRGTRRLDVQVEPGAVRLVRAPATSAPPIVAALTGKVNVAFRLSMLAGVLTSCGLLVGGRIIRSRGRRPVLPMRHPFVSGGAVALVTRLLASWKRGGGRPPGSSA